VCAELIGPAAMSFCGPRGPSVAVVSEPNTIVCDVSALVHVDAGTVEILARLQLSACRCGTRIRLRSASSELVELLDFMGMKDVFLGVEPRGETEEREDRVGVEDERELDDPAV
jgi:anti-anti-sigma regulatory factor